MRTSSSAPDATGACVVLELDDDVLVVAHFSDEDRPRDVSEWAAELCACGLRRSAGQAAGTEAVAEEVSVGQLGLLRASGSPAPCPPPKVEIRTPDGGCLPIDWSRAVALIAAGIADQVTAGVAAEAAAADRLERPDDWLLPPGA